MNIQHGHLITIRVLWQQRASAGHKRFDTRYTALWHRDRFVAFFFTPFAVSATARIDFQRTCLGKILIACVDVAFWNSISGSIESIRHISRRRWICTTIWMYRNLCAQDTASNLYWSQIKFWLRLDVEFGTSCFQWIFKNFFFFARNSCVFVGIGIETGTRSNCCRCEVADRA